MATPTIYLYGKIGYDISGKDISDRIQAYEQAGCKTLDVRIISPGGKMEDGFQIYNSIINSKMEITTYNDWMAASIAGVILLAGDKIKCTSNSMFMLHNPYILSGGGGDGDGDFIELCKQSLITTFVERTGNSADIISEMLNRTTWLNAKEMSDSKFVDEIYNNIRITKNIEVENYENIELVNSALEKIIYNNNMEDNKIQELENKIVEQKNNETKMNSEKEVLEKQIEAMKKENEKLVISIVENAYETRTIDASIKETLINIGKNDISILNVALAVFPSKKAVEAKPFVDVTAPIVNNAVDADKAKWSYTEWMDKDLEGLENLHKLNPDAVKELYNKSFKHIKILTEDGKVTNRK